MMILHDYNRLHNKGSSHNSDSKFSLYTIMYYIYIYIIHNYGSQCKFIKHGQLCPISTLYKKLYYYQRSTSLYLVEVQVHSQVLSESHHSWLLPL